MRILITGANGFVGQHVRRELEKRGHELLTPSRQELDLLGECAVSDITRYCEASLEGSPQINAIVHLAATCGGIGINKKNPGKFIYENLQMGINVLEAARLANISKVVNLGTVCMYPKYTEVPFREINIWDGYPEETNAPYGIAKKAVVEMGIAYHKQYNMNITNLIPTNMAGEWDNFDIDSSHVIPALIRKFERPLLPLGANTELNPTDIDIPSRVYLWGTGSASREFLYAGDCARAIALSLEKDTDPYPINLGAGQEITIHDLAIFIKHLGGYDAEIVWDDSKPDGQPRRSLDCTVAKQMLGWEATTSLEQTICKTIDWYRWWRSQ